MAAVITAHAQTLSSVTDHTIATNPTVAESQAKLIAANEALKMTRSGYLPKLDLHAGIGNGMYDTPFYSDNDARVDETQAGVYLTQPLFSGFSTVNSMKQSRANIQNAAYEKTYTEEQISLAAAEVYLDVLRTKKLAALAKDNTATHEKILQKVSRSQQVGGGNQTDVHLAEGRLAESKTFLQSAVNLQNNAISAFIEVTGLKPQQLIEPKLLTVPSSLQQAKQIALQNNPALLAAESTIEATAAGIAAGKGKFYPRIDAEVNAIAANNVEGFAGRENQVRGVLVANYNLFRGGADRAHLAVAEQQKAAAISNHAQIRRQVINQVTSAWNNMITDRMQLKELQQHVASSKKALYGYRKQFIAGRRTLLDVLDMENELFRAKAALLNEQYALKKDSYTLLAQMGKLHMELKKNHD